MKNKIILVIIIAALLSCQKDSPTSLIELPDNNNPYTSKIIGNSGGVVSADSVQIIIPPNSFSADTEIKITDDASFCGTESASNAYKIEGIPNDFNGNLTLMIKANSSLLIKHTAVMAENIYGRGNKLSTVTNYLPVIDSNGFKISKFSIAEPALNKFLSKGNSTTSTYFIQLSSTAEMQSTGGHFKIIYPTKLYNKAVTLGEYLEECVQKASTLGFNIQTGFPLKVAIKKFSADEEDIFGKYSHSFFGGEIEELNQDLISEANNFKTTAAHEYFHFVQDKYDSRNIIYKGNSAPQSLWIDEATSVWFESEILNNDNYISPARLENELAPFIGMHAEPGITSANGADEHGYGMSGVIKYLTKHYGSSIVKTIYEKIKAGSHPVEAVFIATPDPISYWWKDFLTKYTLGEISSDMTVNKLVKNNYIETISIDQSNDTIYTINSTSKDLSGKLFNILLDAFTFTDGNKLTLNLTAPNYCELSVFAYKNKITEREIKLIEQNESTVTVEDLKTWKDNGYNLLGLVTNHQIKNPYTNLTNIKLDLNLEKQEKPSSDFDISKIKYIAVHASIEGLFEGFDGEQYLAITTKKISNKNYISSPLNLTSNSVDFYVLASDSISISATVDLSNGMVLNFHAARKEFGGGDRTIITGHDFPFRTFVESNGKRIGFTSGISNNGCNNISYFHWDYWNMKRYLDLTCEGGNTPSIFIYFLTENPGWL